MTLDKAAEILMTEVVLSKLERLAQHLLPGNDLTLAVLKGHLLIEEVLEELNISNYMHIYIKRMRNGDWIDQSECEFDGSPDEMIAEISIIYNSDIFEIPDDDMDLNRESEINEPTVFRREIITR